MPAIAFFKQAHHTVERATAVTNGRVACGMAAGHARSIYTTPEYLWLYEILLSVLVVHE